MDHKDQIKDGKAANRHPREFDPKEIAEGIEHELEHTSSRSKAREIAMDHLAEDSKYYTHLKKIHKDGLGETSTAASVGGGMPARMLVTPILPALGKKKKTVAELAQSFGMQYRSASMAALPTFFSQFVRARELTTEDARELRDILSERYGIQIVAVV